MSQKQDHQEIITIFRNILPEKDEKQSINYPELEEFMKKGYYIEDFQQTMVGERRFMLTIRFRRFSEFSSAG